jgi:hypothetical protein
MARGRVERASILREKLVETAVISAITRAHPEHDPNFQTRWAAQMQLNAIIDFIEDDQNLARLIPDLHRLQEAILDIENGRRVPPWLMPNKKEKGGQPPLKVTVSALRGRYAAVMDFLMKRGKLGEIEAAKYVVRHGKPEPLMRGKADAWKVVQDWRQKMIAGEAEGTIERDGFRFMWELIDRLGFGQPGAATRAEAKKLMRGLKTMASEENPTNPSC